MLLVRPYSTGLKMTEVMAKRWQVEKIISSWSWSGAELGLIMVEMLREMLRMLMGAQQMKKTMLTPTKMLFVLFLLAIFLVVRTLFLLV